MLTGQHIYLRALQRNDAETMLEWENDTDNWNVSGTKKPYTAEEIEIFVNTRQDLIVDKQFRYVICLDETKEPIGTIDLFEFDAQEKSVGVGILIADKEQRKKGYAFETLKLIISYCRNELQLVNLFCNIQKENRTSIRLFEKCGFQFIETRTLFEKEVNYYELIK